MLLRFAVDADARPGNSFKAGGSDFILAFHADPIGALVNTVDGFLDGPEQFMVGLFESEADVKIVFLAGLIDPIAALGTGFRGGRPSGS